MKQQKFVEAYKIIQKYENEKLPLDISYGFFKVKKLLQDQWDFEVSKETEIFNKYQPTTDENGVFNFKSAEDQTNFSKEFTDLLDMEVDWNSEKIKINFGDRIEMSLAEIEALNDFIEF